jgi:hypothetical protein
MGFAQRNPQGDENTVRTPVPPCGTFPKIRAPRGLERAGCKAANPLTSTNRRGREVDRRVGIAHLCLANAGQGFLVTEVDLDVPAPDIFLDDVFEPQIGVGADQIGGLSLGRSRASLRTWAKMAGASTRARE